MDFLFSKFRGILQNKLKILQKIHEISKINENQ